MKQNLQRGVGLIEVAIGIGIVAVFIVGVILAFRQYLAVGLGNTAKIQAAYYAEEGIEVARALRDSSWSTFAALSTTTTYYLAQVSGVWATTTTATTTLPGFTRTLQLGSVYRDNSTSNIVAATSSNKYLDPDARQVTVSVSWVGPTRSTISYTLTTYLTKIF